MSIIFNSVDHSYTSLSLEDAVEWTSVTKFISKFKHPFDAENVAKKVAKNKKSKWYGMNPEDIKQIWSTETDRALELGNWYHDQRELDIVACENISREGINLQVFKPILEGSKKIAPEQRLVQGIYPEHLVYLKSVGLCGQSDRVEIIGDKVNIIDYKTNKEIKKESYKDYKGTSKKMLDPLSHLDDCNFYHYALQLSMYMFFIIRHNPNLKPGKLLIQHIVFESDGVDEYGNPIYSRSPIGDPIVKDVINYEVPYLKAEIKSLIDWKREGKIKL